MYGVAVFASYINETKIVVANGPVETGGRVSSVHVSGTVERPTDKNDGTACYQKN
jgi:hypothetical protein